MGLGVWGNEQPPLYRGYHRIETNRFTVGFVKRLMAYPVSKTCLEQNTAVFSLLWKPGFWLLVNGGYRINKKISPAFLCVRRRARAVQPQPPGFFDEMVSLAVCARVDHRCVCFITNLTCILSVSVVELGNDWIQSPITDAFTLSKVARVYCFHSIRSCEAHSCYAPIYTEHGEARKHRRRRNKRGKTENCGE